MKKILNYIQKETVFCVSVLLAFLSMFLVPVDKEYLRYVDFKVLAILFCLMLVLSGFQKLGLFQKMAKGILKKVKNIRQLFLVQVLLCFFTSMLITNDVALITFVPFAVYTLQLTGKEEKLIPMIVLQTIGANLGSMFTPIGNPQNLYLYESSGMGIMEFFQTMLPLTFVSLICLLISCFFIKQSPLEIEWRREEEKELGYKEKRGILLYTILFLLSIFTVLRVIDISFLCIVTLLSVLIYDKSIIKKVDYSLLFTFAAFFVFIGNLGRIEALRSFLESAIEGKEILAAFLTSQILSNVPATVLLSEFTTQWRELLWGINIGGLGTIIASMASVISFKIYGEVKDSRKGKYLLTFTGYSMIFAVILLAITRLL